MWDFARLKIMPGKSSSFCSDELLAVDQMELCSEVRISETMEEARRAVGERD